MQMLRSHPHQNCWVSMSGLRLKNLHFKNLSKWFWCTQVVENYHCIAMMFILVHQNFLDSFVYLFFYPHPQTYSLLLERGEGRERETGKETLMWERNINQLPLICTSTRDQTHNLGMCPEQESISWPLALWNNVPTNWVTLARAPWELLLGIK